MGKQAGKLSQLLLFAVNRRTDSLGGPVRGSRLHGVLAAVVNHHLPAAAGEENHKLCLWLCAPAKPSLWTAAALTSSHHLGQHVIKTKVVFICITKRGSQNHPIAAVLDTRLLCAAF